MFTGIVETTGRVIGNGGGRISVEAGEIARRTAVGGSVAVNGACLTVVGTDGARFEADVVPETLKRTNLGPLKQGDKVNLELPLTLERPLDGHLVQGHVDAAVRVLETREAELGREVTFELPDELSQFVAEKGSIAVDGVSLTVTAVGEGDFQVALIPHTLEHTIASSYERGTLVNVEVDLLARYVKRLAGI